MKISSEAIKLHILSLNQTERSRLLKELQELFIPHEKPSYNLSRRELLNNKQGICPHCGQAKYVKYGIDKGHNAISVSRAKETSQNTQAHGLHVFKEKIKLMRI